MGTLTSGRVKGRTLLLVLQVLVLPLVISGSRAGPSQPTDTHSYQVGCVSSTGLVAHNLQALWRERWRKILARGIFRVINKFFKASE